jgi:hypothetical protein
MTETLPAYRPPSDGGAWSVYREDDNGNRFEMSRGHTEAEARLLVRTFESRGHKQRYWAASTATPGAEFAAGGTSHT